MEYTVAERYTLPSHGLIYEKDVNPDIKLRAMTVRDEMKRSAPSTDGTLYRNMSEILDNCLVEKPGISSYDMCVGDYQFLLYKLRIVTYGTEYRIESQCPLCHTIDEHIIDLEKDLSLKELTEFDREKELTITLPVSKKVIELNITTPRLLDNIELDIKRIKKQYKEQRRECSETDWRLLYQLVYSIKTVDGQKLSIADKESFCNKLVGRDFNAIIQRLDKLDGKVGLGATATVHCNNCGYEYATVFPITREFYRPTTDD